MSQQVSERVALKAARLNEEGRVEPFDNNPFLYRVEGDNGVYVVMVGYAAEVSGTCSCPAKGKCAHLIAACAYHLTLENEGRQERHLHVVSADPYAGLGE